jgi:transcriptional regulator with XRE-family HTH domain
MVYPMPRKNLTSNSAPSALADLARQLGANITIARKRRRLSQGHLARKAGISRSTLIRAEAGDLGVGLGIYLAALWALGLERQVHLLASRESDLVGATLEAARLGQRIRAKKGLSDDF